MSQLVPKLEVGGAIKVGKAIVENRYEEVIKDEVTYLDLGEPFDFSSLEKVMKKIERSLQDGKDAASLELEYSGDVYLSLKDLKPEFRDDSDVWRGITAVYFIEQAMARTSNHEKTKWEILGAGSNRREILAWRMFARGQLCHKKDEDGKNLFPYIQETGKDSHDFWMSHVLGNSTIAEKSLGCALVKQQGEKKLASGPLRSLVRDAVNRPKRTLATFLMSEEEAYDFLQSPFEDAT